MQAEVQSISEMIRRHVRDVYLKPSLRRGEKTLTVNAGAVQKSLGLNNRVAGVWLGLKSKKLLKEHGLEIISQTGPPSGQSTTVSFTYEIVGSKTRPPSATELFLNLRGMGKDVFQQLGGGEAFLRAARQSFSSA